ncbi:MAG: hypothetical protein ACKVTZ_21530 [Bacteroidia bacterium]
MKPTFPTNMDLFNLLKNCEIVKNEPAMRKIRKIVLRMIFGLAITSEIPKQFTLFYEKSTQ